MILTEALTDGIIKAITAGTSIRPMPVSAQSATTEDDRFYGNFIFIPVLIGDNETKSIQKKIGQLASRNAQSATDGIPGCSAMFHQDPNEPCRGTITIRCFA